MKNSSRRETTKGKAVVSQMGIKRLGASASAGVFALALSACSDGGIGAEPEVSGKADSTRIAQPLNSRSTGSAANPGDAKDDRQAATSVEEKTRGRRRWRFASGAVAAVPVAPQAPFISGKIVAAALSIDLNQVGTDLITAHLGGDPEADAIQVSNTLADDRYFAGSNGIIPNNPTPYSCCLAGYPGHSMGALYSFVTGGLTLSDRMNVWTASTPRDSPEPTVMVRQEGDLAIQDSDKVLLDTTHANWIGPSPYYVQMQVASDTDPEAFRLCWHVIAPMVRRLSCGIYSRDSAAFRGTYVIDDSAGVGPRTFRTVDPQ